MATLIIHVIGSWVRDSDRLGIHFISKFTLRRSRSSLKTLEHFAIHSAADIQTLCSFLPVDLFPYFSPRVRTNGILLGAKIEEEKLTFSLNGGGMGRRDAAVTMQGRPGLLLSSRPAKTRFMTSRRPSYFSSWCTQWVVYLGLRALTLSPSPRHFRDSQW